MILLAEMIDVNDKRLALNMQQNLHDVDTDTELSYNKKLNRFELKIEGSQQKFKIKGGVIMFAPSMSYTESQINDLIASGYNIGKAVREYDNASKKWSYSRRGDELCRELRKLYGKSFIRTTYGGYVLTVAGEKAAALSSVGTLSLPMMMSKHFHQRRVKTH